MKFYSFYVPLVLLFLFGACTSDTKKPIDFDRNVVAIVGLDTITIAQFKLSYETAMLKTAETDNNETRQFHLNRMVEGYLLAQSARKHLLDTSANYQQFREMTEREVMREYQFEEIHGDIFVSDLQLEEAFRRSQESRLVRHLFSKNKSKILEWYDLLQNGNEDFYSLAPVAFINQELQNNGGLLGWLSWGDTDLKFEDVIYSIGKGSISEPFQSIDGWHIIRVEEIKRNLIPSKTELEKFKYKNRDKLIRIYQQDKLSDYLSGYMKNQELTINIPLVREIASEIREIYRDFIGQEDVRLTRLPGTKLESVQLRLKDLLNETLVTSKNRIWTVQDFLNRIPELPARFIFQEFDKALAFAVRNDILAEEAYRQGLDKLPNIREHVTLKCNDYLARLETQRMIQQIPVEMRPNFTEEDGYLYQLQQWRKLRREYIEIQKKETVVITDYRTLSRIKYE
ncbi:MAG: peptidylprolyl isomerase [Candidatus Marinimicrobia bacterium]|nr:peptidylprolyl isomerase [Candidatus Neomarinimicrobiota bacterium]